MEYQTVREARHTTNLRPVRADFLTYCHGVLTLLWAARHRCRIAAMPQPRKEFRDIQVKVHIRRPEKDSWAYLGRALVSQEFMGQNSRVGM